MSRPPVPHPTDSTGRDRSGDPADHDYLPLEYADLLALEDQLSVSRLGRPLPGLAPASDDADTTRTFMELSALVAHVLAVHQRRYAGEAFIGTARAASNMVRHARRLAHRPDPGLAASGYVVLTTKEGVVGTVAAGLPLASVPLGEHAAQDYETIDDLEVDAALNDLEPWGATAPVRLASNSDQLRLAGVGHGIGAGDAVALVGPHWQGFLVAEVTELPGEDATVVRLNTPLTRAVEPGTAPADDPAVLLAHPARVLRPFGSSADGASYPPREVRNAGGPPVAGAPPLGSTPRFWYEVQRSDGGAFIEDDVYLMAQEQEPLRGSIVLRRDGSRAAVLRVRDETAAAVTLRREAVESFTVHKVTVVPKDGGFESTLTDVPSSQTVRSHLSGTVTAMQVTDRSGAIVPRTDHPVPADWLTGWATEAPLAERQPSRTPLPEPLILAGQLAALTAGRPIAFADKAGTAAEIVTVSRATIDTDRDQTHIWWEATGVGGPPAGGWMLDDLRVHGNVARVSHGRSVDETLGGSDGVTPFQRFALKETPVTILTGASGGEPELEVRVDGVRWTRVPDLALSGPDDRHHRFETDDRGVTSVVFGDSRNGAVPPSGTKNITATYRVGLGRDGDVGPRRLSRIKRAHPLLERAVNLTPISGGTQPAGIDAIRSQAPRFIRTFDRAVSVPDLADLALTIPGIARSAARWEQAAGAVLVVATSTGDTPPALDAVRAFIDARRDTTVPLRLVGPQPRDIHVVVEIDADPAYLAEVVKGSVRTALHGTAEDAPGLFTFPARDLGQPAYLSELYRSLEAVTGVIGARVAAFGSRDATGVTDVIPAGVDEWLRLPPNDLTVTIRGGPA